MLASPVAGQTQADLWTTIKTEPHIVLVGRHMDTGPGSARATIPVASARARSCSAPGAGARPRPWARLSGSRASALKDCMSWPRPLCRNRDTGMLAFGKATLDPALRESFSGVRTPAD